jgi:hypothetical protein
MDAPATLVWIAPEPPDGPQARALLTWARTHGVMVEPPRDERPPALPVDESIADAVEALLDRARDALAARDGDALERLLSSAESMLRAHPELPQAAWLMAEVQRARAAGLRRIAPVAGSRQAADHAWEQAEALDGGRAPGLGEQASDEHPPSATIALELVPAGAQARLDGEPVHPGAVTTRAGTHALVVTWDGEPVGAWWIEAPAGSSTLRVAAPAAPPCSKGDVRLARVVGDSIDAADVRCTQWVAAAPAARSGAVRVATCEAHACGPLLDWSAPARAEAWTWTPAAEPRHGRWPAWATWGLVGAGAAIATGIVVVAASGVLRAAPSETRFVIGGVKTQ